MLKTPGGCSVISSGLCVTGVDGRKGFARATSATLSSSITRGKGSRRGSLSRRLSRAQWPCHPLQLPNQILLGRRQT